MSHNRDLSAAAAQIGFHSSNIGIGTDAPSETITLNHASGASIGLEYGGSEHGSINVNSAAMYARAGSGKHLILGGNATEALRLKSDGKAYFTGNLGLGGQTSPSGTIHINDLSANGYELKVTGNALQFNRSSNSYIDQLHDTGSILFRMTSSNTEAMRITSTGRIGINQASPEAMLQVDYDYANSEVGLRLRAASGSGTKTWQLSEINGTPGVFTIRNATNSQNNLSIDGSSGYVGVNATNPDRRLEVVETASSLTFPVAVSNFTNASTGVGAAIDFRLTTSGNSRGELGLVYAGNSNSDGTDFVFKPNDGSTGNVERLRITNDGKFGFNTTNPGAFDSGANHFVVLGNTSGTGDTGITIASGTGSYGNIYFADGTSGADAYRGHISYNHNGNTMRFATNGSEKVRILSSGFVNIGNGYLTNSNSGLHVGRSSGGTAAGESVLAATLGNGSTMNNALLTVKNAGDRGSQGHAAGSPLAKFEFNNGTAFEVNKNGQVTTPYQPAFMAKLSTATGQNFNGTLVFNSVNHNIGGHYNSSNGRFTAPVAGRYLFNWYTNVDTNSNSTSLWGDWLINGNYSGYRFYTYVSHSGWELLTASIIFNLSANDYVNVYVSTSGNYDGGSYGSFNGCLLG